MRTKTTQKRDRGQHAARVVDPIVQVVGALDAWWVKYGVGWSAVRTLVSLGHDEEDILGELRATLIARQGMGSRYNPARSTLDAYVGVVARSRVFQLLRRCRRRVRLVLDFDDQRHADEAAQEDVEPGEAIGLALKGGRRKPREPRTERAPAVLRRRARERRRPDRDESGTA